MIVMKGLKMDRTDNFEKYKITKASTNKVVTNVYMDAFGIEKVRFQNVNYKDKNSIDCYLEFEEVSTQRFLATMELRNHASYL